MVKQKKVSEELVTHAKNNSQKSKPTPEQMRIAQILDNKVIDPSVKHKLKEVMYATQRSADEVYVALHDSDFDMNRAVDLLIEGDSLADWCTSEKKKKKLQEMKEKKTDDAVGFEGNDAGKSDRNSSYKHQRDDNRRRPGRGRGGHFNDQQRSRGSNDDSQHRNRNSAGRGRKPNKPVAGGTMVFERSSTRDEATYVPPVKEPMILPATSVKNQWEKPLIRNHAEDEVEVEEFTGSLSQTQIFTSKAQLEPKPTESPKEQFENLASNLTTNFVPDAGKPLIAPQPQALPPKPFTPEMVFTPKTLTHLKHDPLPSESPPITAPYTNSPINSPQDFLYRLANNYSTKPDLPSVQIDKKPTTSRIPTSAVEMPPEMKSSLSFLDIQFGAIDLGPTASDSSCNDSNSNVSSQNTSNPNLMPSTLNSTSGSSNSLLGNAIMSNGSATNLRTQNYNASSMSGLMSSSVPSVTGMGNMMSSNVTTAAVFNHFGTSNAAPSVANMSHMTPTNLTTSTSLSHLMGQSSASAASSHHLSNAASSQAQGGRFLSSSQSYHSNHIPYNHLMTAQNTTATRQYESQSHETNTSIPPPSMTQPPHLPPYKQTPPGVPKGAIVANLPPASLVGNQYLVGQNNVPYYATHPIYYYDEMSQVMNNQQRVTHHMSSGYNVNYLQSNPSTRDGVNYNV